MTYTNRICASFVAIQKNAITRPREWHGHAAFASIFASIFASTWKARLAAAAVQRDGWSCEAVAIARVASGTNINDFPGFSCP